MDTNTDAILAEAAQATAAAGKKTRTPKGSAGESVPKVAKEPKEKLYVQWNEDGSPMLDADGNRVKLPTKMEKPKVAKAPKLDADGNPIPRKAPNRIAETSTLHFTELGAGTQFKSGTKRGDNYTAITEGMTVADYYAANGGRGVVGTFLIWYVGQGLVEVRAVAE